MDTDDNLTQRRRGTEGARGPEGGGRKREGIEARGGRILATLFRVALSRQNARSSTSQAPKPLQASSRSPPASHLPRRFFNSSPISPFC